MCLFLLFGTAFFYFLLSFRVIRNCITMDLPLQCMVHNHFLFVSFPKVSMGQLDQIVSSRSSFMQHVLLLCGCAALRHHRSHKRRESHRQFILCYHFRATFDNPLTLPSCHFAVLMNFQFFFLSFFGKKREYLFACLWSVFVMARSPVKKHLHTVSFFFFLK